MTLRYDQKGVSQGKRRPGHGEGTELLGLRIVEEDPPLAPGLALGQEEKGLTDVGMEGMRDGEVKVTLWVIRCS
jgi:hypothetical protein